VATNLSPFLIPALLYCTQLSPCCFAASSDQIQLQPEGEEMKQQRSRW
jgi:hypothetical protein